MKEGQGDERMRGDDDQQEGMFSYISPEKRVPADHPLRPIRKMVDEILKEMSPKFAKLYSDPEARLFKKSKGSEAKLSYLGHVLMENRNGLLVQTFLTEANGRAERDTALLMAEVIPGGRRVTLGGDKKYDTQEFARELRGMNITPHVAQNDTNRSSAIDQRTARHPSYAVSQRKRKRVEQSFWVDEDGGDAQESEITRDRQGGVAVHLHGSRLQPLRIAKPDVPSMNN